LGRASAVHEKLHDLVRSHEQLTPEERRVLIDVFSATDRVLQEVMVSRTEVDFQSGSMATHDGADFVVQRPQSGYPVIGSSPDDITGVVHVREVMAAARRGDDGQKAPPAVADLCRHPLLVPGTLPLGPAWPSCAEVGTSRSSLTTTAVPTGS